MKIIKSLLAVLVIALFIVSGFSMLSNVQGIDGRDNKINSNRNSQPIINDYTITEYTLPTIDSSPNQIAINANGTIFYTDATNGGEIGKMTESGSFTEYLIPTSNSMPMGIAINSNGTIFFTEYGTQKIGKMTERGSFTEYAIAGVSPERIAINSNGTIFFTDATHHKVCKMTESGSFTKYTLAGSYPQGITINSNGTIFFTDSISNYKIGKMTESGSFTEYNIPTMHCNPIGMAIHDNLIYFAETEGQQIGTMTESGTIQEYNTNTCNSPQSIAIHSDGTLFYTSYYSNKIGMMTPSYEFTEWAVPTSASHPDGIAINTNGTIFFCEVTGRKIGKMYESLTTNPELIINSPVSNPSWDIGTNQEINFTIANGTNDYNVWVNYSYDSGNTFYPITDMQGLIYGISGDKSLNWTIPDNESINGNVSYLTIDIVDSNNLRVNLTSDWFLITHPPIMGYFTNGIYGEHWKINNTYTFNWVVAGGVGNISVYQIVYNVYAGGSSHLIATNPPNTGSYTWKVNGSELPNHICRVMMSFNDSGNHPLTNQWVYNPNYTYTYFPFGTYIDIYEGGVVDIQQPSILQAGYYHTVNFNIYNGTPNMTTYLNYTIGDSGIWNEIGNLSINSTNYYNITEEPITPNTEFNISWAVPDIKGDNYYLQLEVIDGDGNKYTDMTDNVIIENFSSFSIESPIGSDDYYYVGQTIPIIVNTTNLCGFANYTIFINVTFDDGDNYTTALNATFNTTGINTFYYVAPNNITELGGFNIIIYDKYMLYNMQSSDNFTIWAKPNNNTVLPLSVTISRPTNGDIVNVTDEINILYAIHGGLHNYKVWLNYSTDNGITYDALIGDSQPVIVAVSGNQYYSWIVPNETTTHAKINIVVIDSLMHKANVTSYKFTIQDLNETEDTNETIPILTQFVDFLNDNAILIIVLVVVVVGIAFVMRMGKGKGRRRR